MDILNMENHHRQTIRMLSDARHDMINHLQVIHAYAKLNKTDKIFSYIDAIAHEYQMQSRVSRIGDVLVATNLLMMVLKFPELQVDFYGHRENVKLSEYLGCAVEEVNDIILSTITTLASQEQGFNEVQIIITTDHPTSDSRRKISLSLYSKDIREQRQSINCLIKRLDKYGVALQQVYQDKEVFEWELLFGA